MSVTTTTKKHFIAPAVDLTKATLAGVVHILKHEPVAVWGVVLAAVIGVLPLLGVSAAVVEAVGTALTLLGVPVVRGKVTPKAALVALVAGAVKEEATAPANAQAPAAK